MATKKTAKKKVQYWGTGRRKKAIARVRLIPGGEGAIVINKRDITEYFPQDTMKLIVRQPLVLTNTLDKYDVFVNVCGGGYTGQAGAIRHGIARALIVAEPELRSALKKEGYLTRDPRAKERKKYGLKKARKAPQFSKRQFSFQNRNPSSDGFFVWKIRASFLRNFATTVERRRAMW